MTVENLLSLFPKELRPELAAALNAGTGSAEEIRCRIGYPIFVLKSGGEKCVLTCSVTQEHLDYLFERATSASVHAYTEEIQNGFLFTSSGYRIGLCGTMYGNQKLVSGIRDLTSVSVRIPHEMPGCADKIYPQLTENGFQSTLILSPPGYGKTTLLRELIRKLSLSGFRISVADERGEIAAVHNRRRAFDLGPNTDVMTGGRKGESAMMLLRAMNPQILAFDEITDAADLRAVMQAAGCGVSLLATAHAYDQASLQRRSLYRKIMNMGIFLRSIWIHMTDRGRNYVIQDV